ncbi:MAG: cyclase family protein [Sporichthyaceae bacterium]
MHLIDLSHPIRPGMPVWPGDPQVEFHTVATTSRDGFNLLALHLGTQSGTHVDAPFHVDDALPSLHELPLERFVGRALVADLRGLPDRAPIGPDLLASTLATAKSGDVLLLCTGWSRHWGTDRYAAHPWLHPDAARAAVATGIRTVGIDAPSVDTADPALPTHHVLAAAHCVIAENLRDLERMLGRVSRNGSTNPDEPGTPTAIADDVRNGPLTAWRVWLLPLALEGADGSPVRAVAQRD